MNIQLDGFRPNDLTVLRRRPNVETRRGVCCLEALRQVQEAMTRERIAARIRTARPTPDLYSLQAAHKIIVLHGATGAERAIGSRLLSIAELNTFVEAAYLTVLGRQADAGGRRHYLEYLAKGWLTRAHVLRAMLRSPEGRALNTRVEGSRARLLLMLAFFPANSRLHHLAMFTLRRINRLTGGRFDT